MRRRAYKVALGLAVALLVRKGAMGAQPAVSVVVGPAPVERTLVLNPGFVMTLRFDRGVSHVAVGDETVVSVRAGGWLGRDVVLSPLRVGETNMHVWAADLLTLWRVVVSDRVPRTSELVLVRFAGLPPKVEKEPAARARPGQDRLVAELRSSGIRAVFEVERTRHGVAVRYRLTNESGRSYRLAPSMAVVQVEGRSVPFTLLREVRGVEPHVLLPGDQEVGVFSIGTSGRNVRVLLPLYPDGPGKGSPVWFDPTFVGVDLLKVR